MTHRIIEDCTGCTACVRQCPVGAISGERKHLHVIDPRICIDCGACGRICPVDAVLAPSGERVAHIKPSMWPKPEWDYETCTDCKVCVASCPTGSIGLAGVGNSMGLAPSRPWLQNPKTCIACAFCELDCPVYAITMKSPQAAVQEVKTITV